MVASGFAHGEGSKEEFARADLRDHLLLALMSPTMHGFASIAEMLNDDGPKMIYRPCEITLYDHEARCVDVDLDDARWNAFNAAVERSPR